MSTEELVERFEIDRVGRASAVFDEQKLRWMNGRFMREESLERYERQLLAQLERDDPAAARAFAAAPGEARAEACAIVQEKAQTVTEVWPLIAFLFVEPVTDETAWRKVMKPSVLEPLRAVRELLDGVHSWDAETLESELRGMLERHALSARKVLQPLRVAISGGSVSPGIFESVAALGRERTIERLDRALQRLEDAAAATGSEPADEVNPSQS